MTRRIIAAMALTLLCAGSMEASAAISQTHSDRVMHHTRHVAPQHMAAMRAAAPERPTVFPSAWPRAYPYNLHETDGLSRNPNDCAVWGCIDNSN
jgi:hypothetical protein